MKDTVLQMPKRGASFAFPSVTGSSSLPRVPRTPSEDIQIFSEQAIGNTAAVISIDRLYDRTESSAELIRVLDLLSEATEILQEARSLAAASNLIESDRLVMRFQLILKQLFAFRKFGDGFGNMVNSMTISLVNKKGQILGQQELTALWRIIKDLRERPFLGFEASLDLVENLEDAGFEVDPSVLNHFQTVSE